MHKDHRIINYGSKWKNRKNIKKPCYKDIPGEFYIRDYVTRFIPNEQRIINSVVSFYATMTLAIKGQVKFLPHRLWSTRYTFMHLESDIDHDRFTTGTRLDMSAPRSTCHSLF